MGIKPKRAAVPSTNAKLEMLEPITLPKAKSGAPFSAEFKLTKSSGADVRKATTVRPTVKSQGQFR